MNQVFTAMGMTCSDCEKSVSKALPTLDAQVKIVITLTLNALRIDSQKTREALDNAIAEEGYRIAA